MFMMHGHENLKLTEYYSGHEIGRECVTYGGEESAYWWRDLRDRYCLEGLAII